MGQYYMPLVIDANGNMKTLCSHDFDNGLKLMEHSWIGNNFVNAVTSLIMNNPCKIAWIGDYSNEYEGCAYEKIPHEEFMKFYNAAWDERDRYKIGKEKFVEQDFNLINDRTRRMYLINHTQKTAINIGEYIVQNICINGDWKGWCVNPLPLLTACGNGRGGGDYNYHAKIGIEDVGTWAFDMIEVAEEIPNGYESVMYKFREWD
jgi:hypothetical protein